MEWDKDFSRVHVCGSMKPAGQQGAGRVSSAQSWAKKSRTAYFRLVRTFVLLHEFVLRGCCLFASWLNVGDADQLAVT